MYPSAPLDTVMSHKHCISLRSGKEGKWQDLESRCEQRLGEVHPKSKLLRVATSLLKPGALDEETRKNVDQDITVSF